MNYPVYIAHDTAICRNPPMHRFTGDRKRKFDVSLIGQQLACYIVRIRRSNSDCCHNNLTGVLITHMSSNAEISA